MGIFLKALQRQREPHRGSDFFSSNSLTKIREFYSLFKTISETYSIDTEQFLQLFGNRHQQIFQVLDSDHNLLIDGLELFSGLILLSQNVQFEDKVQFIFELFDFNDLKSLSRTDLEFLFISACNVVSKLFAIKQPPDDSFVEQFVRDEFPADQRVNISQMLKWARKSETVASFFSLVGQRMAKDSNSGMVQKIYFRSEKEESFGSLVDQHQQLAQEKLMLSSSRLFRACQDGEEDFRFDLSPELGWIYGIRYQDVKQFLEYVNFGDEQLILYFVGQVAVIYDIKGKKQRHYRGHRSQIISIAVQGTLSATGDYSSKPEIRIWDYRTLETVQIIKGSYTKGVHLLKFLGDGLLISCGCEKQSAVIIFDIQSGSPIFSTFCCSPAVQICLLNNFTNRLCPELVISSLYSVYHLQGEGSLRNSIKVSRIRGQGQLGSPITACCFFMINAQFRQLKQYDDHVEKHVVTGHEDGSVWVWNLVRGEKQFLFSQESSVVLRLLPTHTHLLVITLSSFLPYYDIHLQERRKIRSIDLTQSDQLLGSYDLAQCLLCPPNRLLLLTQKADLLFLDENEPQMLPALTHFSHKKFKAKLVDQVLAIDGKIRQAKLITREKQQLLYLAVEHTIKAIDLNTHRFVKQWNIGETIVSFDALFIRGTGLQIIAATDCNRLHLFSNLTEGISKQTVDSEILSVLLHHQESPNSLIIMVSTRTSILKYSLIRSSFSMPANHSFPGLSACLSSLESGRILLSGQDNSLYSLLVRQMHAQTLGQGQYKASAPFVKLHFHIPQGGTKLKLPILVGSLAKAQIAARRDGRISLWNSFQQISNRTSISLSAHISPPSDLALTDDQRQLISTGSTDGLVAQWRLRYFVEPGSAIQARRKGGWRCETGVQEFAVRRLQFCKFENNLLGQLYDQHLQVKGINNQTIRRLFRSNLAQWRQQSTLVKAEEPPLHLKLDFAFGIETYHKNNTVIALSDPKRFLYFVSKLVIIYNPALNTQTFYRGHRFKVTCIALLDDKLRVATGEAAYQPTIHIWNTVTLETQRIIETSHRWGIIEIAVRGSTLLSWGLRLAREQDEDGNVYSYQVTDLQKGYILAEREDKETVYALAIDPFNQNKFASCCEGRVIFWEIKFSSILRKHVCWFNGDSPTSCLYYRSENGEADLLVGTRKGDVGIVSREEHWTCFSKGGKDSKQINSLLVIKRQLQTLLIAASEDNYLKIWNSKLEERFCEDMGRMELNQEGSKRVWEGKGEKLQRNCSVQSLSEVQGKNQLRILLGTRNGEVLELVQSKEYTRYGSAKTINFKAVLFLRFNTSQGHGRNRSKVFIAHHPKYQILASIGMDQQLLFWDCQRRRLLHSAYLGLDRQKSYPTAIKFSYSGDYLIVGYSDGLLVFLDSKISKSMQGKADEKYSAPSLNMLKKDKAETGHSVLNMQISENGEFLAVSYHCLSGGRSHAYIELFASRVKDKPRNYTRFENQKIFEHFSTVPCPHTETIYRGEEGIAYGFAAYSMAFAQCQNKHYFLIYFQLLDEFQNRLAINCQGEQQRNYKVWDVSSSTVIANAGLIQSIRWKKFYIHNAIQAQYILYHPELSLQQRKDSPPSNNNLLLPQFTNMALLDHHLVTASLNGDLHPLKLSSLEGTQGEGKLVAKTIPAHSCKINQLETNHDRTILYSTGENDECVLKWIIQETPTLQNEEYDQEQTHDLFAEVPDSDELNMQLQLWKAKFKARVTRESGSGFVDWLKVVDIMGRHAEGVRNNLRYDRFERIIYSSGHAVIAVDVDHGQKEFIYVRDDAYGIPEQITALQLSIDGLTLFTCHGGTRASVMIWQLSSKTLLQRLYFDQLCIVLQICVSEDCSRLLLFGLTPTGNGQISLIDLHNGSLLATCSYCHKQPWQVKSLTFAPHSHDKFVSCGVEHIKSWQLMGGHLVYKNLGGSDSSRINTCLAFIGEDLATCNDRGELTIWLNEPLSRQQHQSMITCISVKQHESLWHIATGGLSSEDCDFQVVLWTYHSGELKAIQRIGLGRDQPLAKIVSSRPNSNRRERDYQVQSLCLNSSKLLVGTCRGDIFQCFLSKGQDKNPIQLFSFEDVEQTKAMFFTSNQQELIQISQRGLLRVWILPKTQLLWSHHFEQETIGMVFSEKNQLVVIAFKTELRFFRWQSSERSLIEIEENYRSFSYITHLVLSNNQKFIAIGIQRKSDGASSIDLYELAPKQLNLKLQLNLDSSILYIDFNRLSSEKAFMLVSTKQRLQLFDLIKEIAISQEFARKIDWIGDGLLLSDRTEKVRELHEESMAGCGIKKMMEIGKNGYLLLDAFGGIHWYQSGKFWASCSLNMSSVDCLIMSASQRYLSVSSKRDRNIVLIELLPRPVLYD